MGIRRVANACTQKLRALPKGSLFMYLASHATHTPIGLSGRFWHQVERNVRWLERWAIQSGQELRHSADTFIAPKPGPLGRPQDLSNVCEKRVASTLRAIKDCNLGIAFGPLRYDVELTLLISKLKPVLYLLIGEEDTNLNNTILRGYPLFPYWDPFMAIYADTTIVDALADMLDKDIILLPTKEGEEA